MNEPRVFKKSEVNILNSPVSDSMPRLTPQIMANASSPERALDNVQRYGSPWPNNTVMLPLPDESVEPGGEEWVKVNDLPALIAQVREEEREEASKRVAALRCTDGYLMDRDEAIAAARGIGDE